MQQNAPRAKETNYDEKCRVGCFAPLVTKAVSLILSLRAGVTPEERIAE